MQGQEGNFLGSKKEKKVFAKDGALEQNQLKRGKCMREWRDPCQRPHLVNHKIISNNQITMRE